MAMTPNETEDYELLSLAMRRHFEKQIAKFDEEYARPDGFQRDPALDRPSNHQTAFPFWFERVPMYVQAPQSQYLELSYRTYIDAIRILEGQHGLDALKTVFHNQPRFSETLSRWLRRPFFLKSYFFSAKHTIRQTKIETEDQFWDNLVEILIGSECLGIPFGGLVFREWIELESEFCAFSGLPIAKEFRVFHVLGKKPEIVPYWPESAILFDPGTEPEGWREQLKNLMTLSEEDKHDLIDQSTLVANRFDPPLNWSFDWARDVRGEWWLIDAADASASWRPE
jgi:hypothetical protein